MPRRQPFNSPDDINTIGKLQRFAPRGAREVLERLGDSTKWVYQLEYHDPMEQLQPVVADIEKAILDIIQPIIDRAALIMLTDSRLYKGREMVASIKSTITWWAEALVNVNNPIGTATAALILRTAFGENIPEKFWMTSLGQLIFLRDGFPQRNISRTEVRWIMGGISRQAVHAMTIDPYWPLEEADEREEGGNNTSARLLTRDSVYKRWHDSMRVMANPTLVEVRGVRHAKLDRIQTVEAEEEEAIANLSTVL